MTSPYLRRALLLGTLASMLVLASSASASPVLRHMYGVAPVDDTTSALVPFDVSATGQLTERTSQSVSVLAGTDAVVVGRSGRMVYVGATLGYDEDDNDVPGSIKIFSVADNGSLSLQQTVAVDATQLALSPDGTRLFASSDSQVLSFAVLGNGSLGAPLTNPAIAGYVQAVAVSPDGATLYVSTYPQEVKQYAIAADGTLTARTPTEVGTFGCWSGYLGFTPDGAYLDTFCANRGLTLSLAGHGLTFAGGSISVITSALNAEDVRGRAVYTGVWPNRIQQLRRLPDGSLAGYAPTFIADTANVTGIAQDPAGTTLIAGTDAHVIQTFAIAPDGSLSTTPVSTTATTLNSLTNLTYAPDQSPVAALSATQDAATTHFDAGSSSAVNGTIARYDWTFGDGATLSNGGATPSHHYATAGDYVARVTLTDSSGCSVAERFMGAMAVCAGSANAATTLTVHASSDPLPPAVTPPVDPITPLANPLVTPPEQPAPRAPEMLVVPRSLTGTPSVSGARVRLSWTPAPSAPLSKRYLIAWSSLHSSQGPADPNMRHIWTTDTQLLLAGARPGTTLHYAVYAYGSDGRLAKAGKTTIHVH